jgi:hypothetical protein
MGVGGGLGDWDGAGYAAEQKLDATVCEALSSAPVPGLINQPPFCASNQSTALQLVQSYT